MKIKILTIVGIVLAGGAIWFFISPKNEEPVVDNVSTNMQNQKNINSNTAIINTEPVSENASFSTVDVLGIDTEISFTATLPTHWQAEAIASSAALNIYNPNVPGDTTLEKSQIFVKYFKAATFLTLTTVTIKSQTELNINGRPAVTYIIEKKPGVPNFPAQPVWRNLEHRVTDIRSTDASPTTFYVFAKAPDLSEAVFEEFLNSITFL